ncbi:MAG TPA: hypothetical protein VFE91_04910, partial [Nitrososphaerales archaeon]|nr:hypothetical protein [Nitrososphaerales archaeon]
MGGVYMDIVYVNENEALNPRDPEHAATFARMKPVRDTSMTLTTAGATNLAVLSESSKNASSKRLASAVKTFGRADEALALGTLEEAEFWLTACSFEFAYAWVYSNDEIPSPSHLLSQLKGLSKGSPRFFEAFSKGAGLEKSTRAGCGSRLEGLGVLHDVIKAGLPRRGSGQSAWSDARFEIVMAKSKELASGMELAECYSYMGQELVDYIQAITAKGGKGAPTVAALMSVEKKVLSSRLLRQLGLARGKPTIEAGLEAVKNQVSVLARRV